MKRITEDNKTLLRKQFGVKLIELRQKFKLTQEELAFRCDTSVSTVNRAEHGKIDPKATTIMLLAVVFEMTESEFWKYCFPDSKMFFDDF